jgi:hypothetical protein
MSASCLPTRPTPTGSLILPCTDRPACLPACLPIGWCTCTQAFPSTLSLQILPPPPPHTRSALPSCPLARLPATRFRANNKICESAAGMQCRQAGRQAGRQAARQAARQAGRQAGSRRYRIFDPQASVTRLRPLACRWCTQALNNRSVHVRPSLKGRSGGRKKDFS